jgi:hypothetical protein
MLRILVMVMMMMMKDGGIGQITDCRVSVLIIIITAECCLEQFTV